MKRYFFALLSLLMCGIFCACQTYEFTGTAGEPLPKDEKTEFYLTKDKIPEAAAEVGIIRFTTSAGLSISEVRQMLKKEALARGANGIYIVKMNPIPSGEARVDQLRNQDAPGWNIQDNSHTSNVVMTDNIMYARDQEPDKTIFKFEVEAQYFYLKNQTESTNAE